MTDFHIVPAAEIQGSPPCLIGLSGMTGSGKTFSGLLIAQALARVYGGPVIAGDTERGRLAKYKNPALYPELHPFSAGQIPSPFGGDVFADFVDSAVTKAKAGCVMIDSGSDEWEGDGGVLQAHDKIQKEMAQRAMKQDSNLTEYAALNKVNMRAWADVKAPHQGYLNKLVGCPVPVILCFRARPKIEIKGGKVIDKGVQPIYDSRLGFDLMFHLLMDGEKGNGAYTVIKPGYRHEREVFGDMGTTGKVDASAVGRLVAILKDDSATGQAMAEPKETAPAPTETPQWVQQSDGIYHYTGDATTREAQTSLFSGMKAMLESDARPAADRKTAYEANLDVLTNVLPEAGQTELAKLYLALDATRG